MFVRCLPLIRFHTQTYRTTPKSNKKVQKYDWRAESDQYAIVFVNYMMLLLLLLQYESYGYVTFIVTLIVRVK